MDFENDPAADFLNREREELAGIINENEGELNFRRFLKSRRIVFPYQFQWIIFFRADV